MARRFFSPLYCSLTPQNPLTWPDFHLLPQLLLVSEIGIFALLGSASHEPEQLKQQHDTAAHATVVGAFLTAISDSVSVFCKLLAIALSSCLRKEGLFAQTLPPLLWPSHPNMQPEIALPGQVIFAYVLPICKINYRLFRVYTKESD